MEDNDCHKEGLGGMDDVTIMVVEDEKDMRKMIRTFLETRGYRIIEATDGTHALSIMEKTEPDLLIVDVMMPFMDGFEFTEKVRENSNIPIIFLSAKGEYWNRIEGLKLGADDYIPKPFVPDELLGRVRSVLRRSYNRQVDREIITIDSLMIDKDSHTVTLDGEPLTLTRKEFHLLHLLAKNMGRVFSREQLLELIWGENHRSSERTVDTHIKTLRIKLGDYGKLIKTVWGIGYKLEV